MSIWLRFTHKHQVEKTGISALMISWSNFYQKWMKRVQELPAMTFLLHRCTSPLAWIFDSCIGTVLVYFVQMAQCTALSLYNKHSASSDSQNKVQPARYTVHLGSRTRGLPILLLWEPH